MVTDSVRDNDNNNNMAALKCAGTTEGKGGGQISGKKAGKIERRKSI